MLRCTHHPFTTPATLGPLLALALLPGVNGCGGTGTQGKIDAEIGARLEAIRQAGQPVTLAELNGWYPQPGEAENAAPLYAEAFTALANTDAKSASFLLENQAALALLHKAAGKAQCRYPVDLTEGCGTALPHLAKIKTCAQLLAKEASDNAAKGHLDLATQDVITALRLGRSLEQEPLLISQLVRFICDAITFSALETALNLKTPTDEQLVRLQGALRDEDPSSALTRPVAAERAMVTSLVNMPLAEYKKLGGDTNFPCGSPTDFDRYRGSAAFSADLGLCLDYFSNWLAVASAPFPASLEAADGRATDADALVSQAKTKGYRVAATMLPALHSALVKTAGWVAQRRIAQAVLAVERYRLGRNSSLPESLAQLVPKHLPAVLEDPFDGKPLRYTRLPSKGYVVYSVGRDRRDDGGISKRAGDNPEAPADLPFSIRR